MKPLSGTLRSLLDEISAVLARGETLPETLLARLESLWREERPGDLAGLSALLASLRARPDDARIAAASARLHEIRAQAAAEVAALRPAAAEKDLFVVTRGDGEDTGEGWLYPVFFGTNRAPLDQAQPQSGFSAHRSGTVIYGRCDVWIPTTHRFGETGTPWWRRWARLQFTDDNLRLDCTAVLTEADLWRQLQAEMARADRGAPHGLVFLHGYNVSFEDAAIRAAQMGFDLKVSGATAFFSWPSQGTLAGYPADAAAIEASEDAMTRFLADFARHSGAVVVHLVAHSMGNRGLLRALQRLAADAELRAGVKFGQIFLAAPDVDRDLFLSLARLYPQFSDRTTLYASNGDNAVAMSAWLHAGPRAGYFPPVTVAQGVDRLDTVTVPDFDLDLLGHSYFAQAEALLHDMFDLIRHGTPPAQRQHLAWEGGHWAMRR
jgi:esterase/lipase superfamily enzyme